MKSLLSLVLLLTVCVNANAQYCGNSGPTVCNVPAILNHPGFSPSSDSLPMLNIGTDAYTTLYLQYFNLSGPGGQIITPQWIRIDSIENLPGGVCWAANSANNTFTNGQNGCIRLTGTVCSLPGQYKLNIVLTMGIGNNVSVQVDAPGPTCFLRVRNSGDAEVALDTTQTVPFLKLPGYSDVGVGNDCYVTAIEKITAIEFIKVVPNPFTDKAVVSFYSTKGGVMTEKITNMIGSEVYSNTIEVKVGENSSVITKSTLPAGVYFYTLADGQNSSSTRILVTE